MKNIYLKNKYSEKGIKNAFFGIMFSILFCVSSLFCFSVNDTYCIDYSGYLIDFSPQFNTTNINLVFFVGDNDIVIDSSFSVYYNSFGYQKIDNSEFVSYTFTINGDMQLIYRFDCGSMFTLGSPLVTTYRVSNGVISYYFDSYQNYIIGQLSDDIDCQEIIDNYIEDNNYHSHEDYLNYGQRRFVDGQDSVDITVDNEQAIFDYILNNDYVYLQEDVDILCDIAFSNGFVSGFNDLNNRVLSFYCDIFVDIGFLEYGSTVEDMLGFGYFRKHFVRALNGSVDIEYYTIDVEALFIAGFDICYSKYTDNILSQITYFGDEFGFSYSDLIEKRYLNIFDFDFFGKTYTFYSVDNYRIVHEISVSEYWLGYSYAMDSQSTFKSLMFALIDAPFNVLSNAFDFTIFGINLSYFLIAIVSLLFVGAVIRRLR